MKRAALPVAWKLALVPAALALLLVAGLLLLSEELLGRHLGDQARAQVEQAGSQLAVQMSRALSRRVSEVQTVSRSVELAADTPAPRMRAELEGLRARTPGFAWLGVTDARGRVVAATDGHLEGESIAQRPVFLQGTQGLWVGDMRPAVAPAAALTPADGPAPELLDIAVPLRDATGELRGVLAAHVSWDLFRGLGEGVVAGGGAQGLRVAVLSQDGALLAGELEPQTLSALQRALAAGSGSDHDGERGYAFEAGGARYVASRHLAELRPASPVLGWTVVALQNLDAALRPVAALKRSVALGGTLLALALGGLGYALSRRLSLPYAGLLETATRRYAEESRRRDLGLTGYLDALAEQVDALPALAPDALPGDELLMRAVGDAQRLRAMLDNLPAPVYLLDAQHCVRYWNHAAERMFGRPAADALGRPIAELLGGDALTPAGLTVAERLRRDEGPFEFCAAAVRGDDGRPVWGEWRIQRLPGLPGASPGLIAHVRDLTDEQVARAEAFQLEHRLREHQATLAAVVESASDAVISTDVDGRIILFNPAAERIFGRAAAAMLGRPLDDLLPASHRGRHGGDLARFAASRVTRRSMGAGRVQGLHADGSVVELEAAISQVTIHDKQVLTAILRDVTERVRAEHALALHRQELAALTQQLMAQEKLTTRRLAQALHDQLGQTLAAIRLAVDTLPGGGTPQRERLEGLADQAVREVRQVLVDLRPPLLDEQGLAAALDNELRGRRPPAAELALQLDVRPGAAGQRWPPDVEYAAFMIAREAVGNALQHAGARQVRVTLGGEGGSLRLAVNDDGRGMAPESPAGRPGHLGLVGMRERALAIDARFELRSTPGEGTTIVLHWQAPEPE